MYDMKEIQWLCIVLFPELHTIESLSTKFTLLKCEISKHPWIYSITLFLIEIKVHKSICIRHRSFLAFRDCISKLSSFSFYNPQISKSSHLLVISLSLL